MKIIITGANGFIGYNLYKALKDKFQDCEFILYDQVFTKDFGPECTLRTVDLMLLKDEKSIFKEYVEQSQYLFHCAAICGVQNFTETYTSSTINLLMDFNIYNLVSQAQNPIRTVYFSTSEVYGPNKNCKETSDFHILNSPRGQYACEKLMGEYLFRNLRTLGKHLTIIRPFNIIGKDQSAKNGHVFPNFIQKAKENQPLTVYNQGQDTRMYCPIEDAVRGIIAVIDQDDDFNIGSNLRSNYLSTLELAKLVIEKLNSKSTIIFKDTQKGIQYRKPQVQKMLKFYKPQVNLKDYLNDFI